MKRSMKKTISLISAIAILMGISTSCSKELNEGDRDSSTLLTVTATMADNGTKVSYSEDLSNHRLNPSWAVNDIIIGFDNAATPKTYGYKVELIRDGVAYLAIITSGVYAGSSTVNPAEGTRMYMFYAPGMKPSDINISDKSLTVDISNQSVDTVPALMMASATVADGGLSLSFTNQTAIIGINNPTMANGNTAYTGITLSGNGINTKVKFDLGGASGALRATYTTPGTITKAVNLTSGSSGSTSGNVYIVACPLTTSADLTFTANNDGANFTKMGRTMAAGGYYHTAPKFVIKYFSVSATKKVFFTKGNLYWDKSSASYKMESNQYDYRNFNSKTDDKAVINGVQTITPANTVGSLFWVANTDGTNAPYNDSFNTSVTYSTSNYLFTNASADTPNASFIVAGETGKYRTLSDSEWSYLLNTRSGNKFAKAKYKNVNGLLIFPDNYSGTTSGSGIATVNGSTDAYPSGNITDAVWTELENAGAVFLPATGYRDGGQIKQPESGLYWASTFGSSPQAKNLFFSASSLSIGTGNRNFARAIRLVYDAN